MKITLTQKSEVRPVSDDESEKVGGEEEIFTVHSFVPLQSFKFGTVLSFYDLDKKTLCRETFSAYGIAKLINRKGEVLDHSVHQVAINATGGYLMLFSPIPGYLNYEMIDIL